MYDIKQTEKVSYNAYNNVCNDSNLSLNEIKANCTSLIVGETPNIDLGKIDKVSHVIERASIIGGDDEIEITVQLTNTGTIKHKYLATVLSSTGKQVDCEPYVCVDLNPNEQGSITLSSDYEDWSFQDLGKKYTIKLYTCKIGLTCDSSKDKFVDSEEKEFTNEELNPCCMNLPLIGCISQSTCKTLKWVGIGTGVLICAYLIYKNMKTR